MEMVRGEGVEWDEERVVVIQAEEATWRVIG